MLKFALLDNCFFLSFHWGQNLVLKDCVLVIGAVNKDTENNKEIFRQLFS